MSNANDPLNLFATRMKLRATHLLRTTERMVPVAFKEIAGQVFLNSPVWSSQSVVNWTASIGRSPKVRLVNVDKSGSADAEGGMDTITVHDSIAQMARFQAAAAAFDVADTYKRPRRRSKAAKSIWLSNVVSYTPDLWTGAWPTNAMRLADTIDVGVRATKKFNVWRF